MGSFIALRKTLDLSSDNKSHLLCGRQNRDIPVVPEGGAVVTTLKKHYDYQATVSFNSTGGSACSPSSYVLGGTYKSLPTPTKTQFIFDGWYTQEDGGTKVTENSAVELSNTMLYAHWEYVSITGDYTSYIAQATSSYKNTGIYSATRYSSASAVYVDWGDGSVEKVNGNISQLAHTYSSAGTYTVKVSNNITNFAPSYNNSTWYNTTSHSRYTFKDISKVGSRCTSLPNYAFYYCSGLSSINWLSSFTSLTQVPQYCFYYCSGIPSLSALSATSIRSVGSYAFQYCTGLRNLSGTSKLTAFNSYSFSNCSNISSIAELSATTIKSLPSYCFYYCSGLKNLNGAEQLTSIGNAAFYYCTGLTGNLNLESFQFKSLYNGSEFRYCSNITAVTLPSALTGTYFGSYTFGNCTNLRSFAFQNQITSVGSYMFYGCQNLSSIQFTNNIRAINSYAFYQCYRLSSVDLPAQLTSLQQYAFGNCTSLVSVDIPSTVTTIGTYAFYYCSKLSSVTLPQNQSSFTSLQNYTFRGCYGLKQLDIPASVTSIGSYTLAGCYNLSSLTVRRSAAPSTQNYTFGYNASASQSYGYTGWNTRGSNVLHVPSGATGYESSYWSSRLLNSSQCGFTISYDL